MRASSVALALSTLIALGACDASEGDACEPGEGRCLDGRDALVCVEGALHRAPCRGAEGCAMDGERMRCDRSVAAVGDACSHGQACAEDMRSFLVCRDGAFVQGAACASGCLLEDDRVRCLAPELDPPLQ